MENELLQKELAKALKQKQKLQDQLNLNRKLVREGNRHENLCDTILEACKEAISFALPKVDYGIKRPLKINQSAVLTLSDLHIAQLVNEKNNYFDLEVAEMRLEKIFNQFIEEVELRGIEDVHILLLGDLIHAQPLVMKKMDMKLSSALPEVQASIKCFEFLSTHIDRLVARYNVSIAGVIGNESRFVSYLNPSNLQSEARNNMDVVIFEMLKQRYRDCSTVEFVNNGDELEDVVNVNGSTILLTHGNSPSINHKDLDKSFVNIKARLEPVYGEIDYMVLGHIHSTMILDRVFRNSSLVGSNAYSNELGFAKSFVSQNMLIIDEDGVKAFSLRA
jgi:predicted phosphodiesterase